MKHQQVVVDYVQMLKTSVGCILLAFFGWILIKLVYAVFMLPGYLEKSHQKIQKTLEMHAKYIQDEPLDTTDETTSNVEHSKTDNEAAVSDENAPTLEVKKLN